MRRIRTYWKWLKRKMLREPLPPEAIAGGWALGMFVGCSVPFGLQLLVSIPMAVMMRVSKIGATFGTLITNPVTIFFIYPAQTWLIDWLFFGGKLSYEKLSNMEWTREAVFRLGAETVICFFLGGLLLALILSPITYFVVRNIVISHRLRRENRLRRMQELNERKTVEGKTVVGEK